MQMKIPLMKMRDAIMLVAFKTISDSQCISISSSVDHKSRPLDKNKCIRM